MEDLNSESSVVMRNAAKKAGEEKLYNDEGIILASIDVLERTLNDEEIDKKDKYLIDGLAWSALNIGNAKDKRGVSVLGQVVGSTLPKKVRNSAIHALKTINK